MHNEAGYFIDERGRRFLYSNASISDGMGARFTAKAQAKGLIVNLGCVLALEVRNSLVVTMRPAAVTQPALTELAFLVTDTRPSRVLLTTFDEHVGKSSSEVLGNWEAALARFADLVDACTGKTSCVLTKTRNPEAPSTHRSLKSALDIWIGASGTWSSSLLDRLDRSSQGKYSVYRRTEAVDPSYALVRVGSGLPRFARDTLTKMIGDERPMWPDRRYSQACDQSYEKVARQRVPLMEDVDAYVYWPDLGLMRRRYQRLLLPLFAADNRELVILSGTSADMEIDLRRAAG